MFPKHKLGYECRDTLIRDILEDVDLIVEAINCDLILVVLELTALPRGRLFVQTAAAALHEELGPDIVSVVVLETTTVTHGGFESSLGFDSAFNGLLSLVTERRCRVHVLDQTRLKAEVLIWLYQESCNSHDDGGDTAHDTKRGVKRLTRPSVFIACVAELEFDFNKGSVFRV